MPHKKNLTKNSLAVSVQFVERRIYLIRGQKVMIDVDLAELYGVPTGVLNQQVKRNRKRFPADFMFQLTKEEAANLKSQFVISNWRGLRRAMPYAFTEQGVAMLSSVLNSKRAVQVNIEIMRTFARLRQLLATHARLARKLEALERRYDNQFKIVFDALRELMAPQPPKRRRIGFLVSEQAAHYGKLHRLSNPGKEKQVEI